MWKAIKINFGSIWGIMGIIVGAISLINLGVMYFDVGIGPVLERIVDTYRSIVHRGFDILFFWVDWQMPAWAKDVTTIYIVFGVATGRGEYLSARGLGKEYERKNSWWRTLISWWHTFWRLVLWWRIGFRATVGTLRQLFKGIDGVRHDRGTESFFAIDKKGQAKERIENFWLFWISFLSVPLAAFLFIVVESGL